jgi:hypothetical protein
VVSEGSGSWLEYIEFDGKMYWNINDEKPKWLVCNDENLPEELKEPILASDSRFRPDIKFMLEKDMD